MSLAQLHIALAYIAFSHCYLSQFCIALAYFELSYSVFMSLALSPKAFSVSTPLSGTHCRVTVDLPNFSALLSVA